MWRHREFTLQYNASCDSLTPKPVAEIIRDLQMSESVRNSETKKILASKSWTVVINPFVMLDTVKSLRRLQILFVQIIH